MKRTSADKQPFARTILVGVVILAVAAVILAWLDAAGYGQTFLRILERGQKLTGN